MTHKGEAYPASGAVFLDNPIRRWLQPPSELVEMLEIAATDAVVDFGCGHGFYTAELAKRAREVVAVDISPAMLQKARNKATKAGVRNARFLQSDGKRIPMADSTVDKVLLVTVYHEVADSETVLKEFRRILKPNGQLIIAEVVRKGIFTAAPVQSPEKLKEEIKASGFKLQKRLPYRSYGVLFFAKDL
ncbi:MAG: class I SAM-dependent methyltransferase [Candidatus Bathyarchaeia archaeon]